MHEQALPAGSRAALDKLAALDCPALSGWTLAGGTGTALQLGHRLSADFDFFKCSSMDKAGLARLQSAATNFSVLQDGDRTWSVVFDGVLCSFFQLLEPMLFANIPFSFFGVADVRDIAVMKLVAIANRGSRKDFIDLFFILKSGVSLADCFKWLVQKHGPERTAWMHVLKSLSWFEDAEREPMPVMLVPFDWQAAKAFILQQAHALLLPG